MKLHCEHLTDNDLDQELVLIHQSICQELGIKLLDISNGARCSLCNKAAGGAEHSVHVPANNSSKKGEALDVPIADSHTRFLYVKKLMLRGITRIEVTNKHVHFDKGHKIDNIPQEVLIVAWLK